MLEPHGDPPGQFTTQVPEGTDSMEHRSELLTIVPTGQREIGSPAAMKSEQPSWSPQENVLLRRTRVPVGKGHTEVTEHCTPAATKRIGKT